MPNVLTKNLPVGDIQFYDNYTSSLTAGNWTIQVDQTVTDRSVKLNTSPLSATQEFVVSAPQFSMDSGEIINQYPPKGSVGLYGEVLPHVVLKDPMLPWERKINDPLNTEPWMALLVFADDELIPGKDRTTHSTVTTVSDFLAPQANAIKPKVTKEDDIAGTDPCSYIQIPVATFQKITPRLQELRYLSHCRQINTSDKAVLGINQHGLFSVVASNRFPATPVKDGDPPRKNIVHLVSVEGLEDYLVDSPNFGTNTSVSLLSLASWTFQSLSDNKEDFRGLLDNIVSSEFDGTTYHPEKTWLRIPPPTFSSPTATEAETVKRISDGFVPLSYKARTGEESYGWYRGPLAPLFTTELDQTSGPFFTADAALIYDKAYGVFDFSLASAWQIGRSIALADKKFGQQIIDFRRRGHRITDNLLHRLQSDHFTATRIDALEQDSAVQDDFISVLNAQLLTDLGATTAAKNNQPKPPAATTTDTDPKTAVQNFLALDTTQQTIAALVEEDLEPISTWLARLALLYPVPFNYFVSDERMLPIESLRFFYLDRNWINALIDGALSIGMESSRDTFFHEITHGLLKSSALKAAQVERAQLLGIDPAPAQVTEQLTCGFLLRSALVSGWPNLAVRPKMNNSDELLKILRMDHLSPTVLFCLIEGVPDYIEFSEPQEGFRFGVDDDGAVPLRNLVPPTKAGDLSLGDQYSGDPVFKIRDLTQQQQLCMRSATSRVLNIAPASADGLIQKLTTANAAVADGSIATIGPGDFALQMVKAPEAIKFATQVSS